MKNSQKLLNIYTIKKLIFSCLCIKWTHGVEIKNYGDEIWINQGQLEKKLDVSSISDKTQYYLPESKTWDVT